VQGIVNTIPVPMGQVMAIVGQRQLAVSEACQSLPPTQELLRYC